MARYTITLWCPMLNDNPHSYELASTEQAKTLREARRHAKRLLGPHRKTTTWELRSHCHAAFCRIERGGVSVESIDAIDYVESIADKLRRGEAVFVGPNTAPLRPIPARVGAWGRGGDPTWQRIAPPIAT